MLQYIEVLIFDDRDCLSLFINGMVSQFKIDFELKVAFFVTDYQENSLLCNSSSFFYAYIIEFVSPRTRFSKKCAVHQEILVIFVYYQLHYHFLWSSAHIEEEGGPQKKLQACQSYSSAW